MKELPVRGGSGVMVDDDDFDWLMQFPWRINKTRRKSGRFEIVSQVSVGGEKKTVYLHRLIMGAVEGEIVDHIDRNQKNNLKSNLRFVTHSQNMRNLRRESRGMYKGVTHYPGKPKPYYVRIFADGVQHVVGSFDTAERAAEAYDCMAVILHGDYAALNFPERDYSDVITMAKQECEKHGGVWEERKETSAEELSERRSRCRSEVRPLRRRQRRSGPSGSTDGGGEKQDRLDGRGGGEGEASGG